VMTKPEIPLTQRKLREVNLTRNMPTPPLKRSHQKAEPLKTPRTRIPADP
jgi:hypothetical protein